MSLGLRRFRLDGIGPPGARFDPLEVSLAGADGARPAATSVLFLENGGGKSVLLRLLFSVVLPGRRYTVGSVKLDGYVGSGDTGHVALEWDTADGLLVTGTLLEWRNRTRSSSSSNLAQFWYSFRPRNGVLTLADLPSRDGDRRVSRVGFRERLSALAGEHPDLELVIEDAPTRWAEHLLGATPIDPEIFRYQRQMNADEADAESLFAGLKTDEDFVRFVVEAVQDPEAVEGFQELLVEYAGHLGRREELELEARFCAEAADALRPLGAAHRGLEGARADAAGAVRAVTRLRQQMVTGAEQATAAALRFGEAATTAATRVTKLAGDAQRLGDTAAELRRREAEFRHADAQAASEAADAEAGAASLTASAWGKVGTVVSHGRLTTELHQLREAQEREEHELAPLRQALELAGSRYAARLSAQADGLDRDAEQAESDAIAADENVRDLGRQRDAHRHGAGAAQAEADGLRGRAAEVDAALGQARDDGLLWSGETPRDATARSGEGHRAAVTALERARAGRRAVEQRQETLLPQLQKGQGEEARLESKLMAAREDLAGHRAAADRLIAHPRVQEIVPDAGDAWVVAERLEQVLDASVRAAEAEERAGRAALSELEQRLEQLGTDGLLPAAPDVTRVWDAIVAAGIPAATGWSYLDHNLDEAGRERALATNPALAGGVIVSDPARVADATRAVAAAGVETESVVLVGAAAELSQPGAGMAAPVRPALYDRSWTGRVRNELEVRRDEHRTALETVSRRLGVDAPLLGEVRDFTRRCPAARRERLADEVEELDARCRRLREEIAALESELAGAREEITTLDRDEPELIEQADAAAERHRRLVALRQMEDQALSWEQQATAAAERHARLVDEARHADEQAEDARGHGARCRARARRARDDAMGLRSDAGQLGVAPAIAPPEDTFTTEALAGAHAAAKEVYESERAGRDLTERIERVEILHGDKAQELAELAPEVALEAETLAAQPGVDDPQMRSAHIADAREAAAAAAERQARCGRALGAARQVLEERQPKGKLRFVTLEPGDEPRNAEGAVHAADAYQQRAVDAGREAREAKEAAEQRSGQAREAEARAGLLTATVEVLPPVEEEDVVDSRPVEPWAAGTDGAQEEARSARARYDEAHRAVAAAERELERTGSAVRRVAEDPSLQPVGGVRVALAHEPLDHLAGRAVSLADELDGMCRSVEEELADALRHREGIVQRLATLVEAQLRQLNLLTRLSTLPNGLGEWSGKPFVAVDFDPVPAAELTARLGPIVDEAAVEPRKRRALDLVLAGMRAAVLHQKGDIDQTFTVRLLRPNRMMSYQRASIAELEGEFSGGMKLTAAICTYCALAALRANCRSTGSLFGVDPGPLFLDNPLGKASADYLLELQHAIAEKLGVQLVHTTGVWDVEALATYERVVRLRNLADLRRNVSRLRVDDEVHLPGSGATIDAVGLTVRRDD